MPGLVAFYQLESFSFHSISLSMRLRGTSPMMIIKWTRLRIGGRGFECLFFHRLTAGRGLLPSAFTVSNITDCLCIIAGAQGSAQYFSAQYRSAQYGGLGPCFISTFQFTLIRFSPRIAKICTASCNIGESQKPAVPSMSRCCGKFAVI